MVDKYELCLNTHFVCVKIATLHYHSFILHLVNHVFRGLISLVGNKNDIQLQLQVALPVEEVNGCESDNVKGVLHPRPIF